MPNQTTTIDQEQHVAESGDEQLKIPEVLPVLPLRDIVIFPFMIVPGAFAAERPRTGAPHQAAATLEASIAAATLASSKGSCSSGIRRLISGMSANASPSRATPRSPAALRSRSAEPRLVARRHLDVAESGPHGDRPLGRAVDEQPVAKRHPAQAQLHRLVRRRGCRSLNSRHQCYEVGILCPLEGKEADTLFDTGEAPRAELRCRSRRSRWRRACGRGRWTSSSARSTCSAPGSALRTSIEQGQLHSMILYGPPGSGKTTLARIAARGAGAAFEEASAVNAGPRRGARR